MNTMGHTHGVVPGQAHTHGTGAVPVNTTTTGTGPVGGSTYPRAPMDTAPAPGYGADQRYANAPPTKPVAAAETGRRRHVGRKPSALLALLLTALLMIGSFFVIFWAKKNHLFHKTESAVVGGIPVGNVRYQWGWQKGCAGATSAGGLINTSERCSSYKSMNSNVRSICGAGVDCTQSQKSGFKLMHVFGEFIMIANAVSICVAFLFMIGVILALATSRLHPSLGTCLVCLSNLVGVGMLVATIGMIVVVYKGFGRDGMRVDWAWIVSFVIGLLWLSTCWCVPGLMLRK